jgi:hypothetical protein
VEPVERPAGVLDDLEGLREHSECRDGGVVDAGRSRVVSCRTVIGHAGGIHVGILDRRP